jgi:hypothetical protein
MPTPVSTSTTTMAATARTILFLRTPTQ